MNQTPNSSVRTLGIILLGVLLVVALRLESRPASAVYASAKPRAEHPIAVVAMPMIVNELMLSDRFTPARERLQETHNARIQEVQQAMQEILRQYEGREPDQNDPRVREDQRRYQMLGQQLNTMRREATAEFDQLSARQLVEAFELVRSAAQGVADDLGYDYVISSVGEDEQLIGTDTSSAVRQLMARPMIHFPEKADITPDVRAELRL